MNLYRVRSSLGPFSASSFFSMLPRDRKPVLLANSRQNQRLCRLQILMTFRAGRFRRLRRDLRFQINFSKVFRSSGKSVFGTPDQKSAKSIVERKAIEQATRHGSSDEMVLKERTLTF